MPVVEQYAHGQFCWTELATTDQAGAKTFYNAVFGWTSQDMEYAPGEFYTMFYKGDKCVGAGMTLDKAQREMGVPSHWNCYVNVQNVDEVTARVAGLGGTVMAPAFDVMDIGRMSIISDPSGAVVFLWQKVTHAGADINDEEHAFGWYELATNKVEECKSFYTQLLGWGTGGSADYVEWQCNNQSIGGMMHIPDVPPNWMPYVFVSDCDATAAKVGANGGIVLIGPGNAGDHGRFCIIRDPAGAHFAVYQRLNAM